MKDFLKEIIRLWWVEAGTELNNPKSEASIKALKTILREDFELDSEFIDYIVDSVNKTPTNFVLHGDHDSGIKVGKNQTAVSAKIHPDYDEEEITEDDDSENDESEEEVVDKDDSIKDIKLNGLTDYEKDKLKEEVWVKNIKSGNVYQAKEFNGETHAIPTAKEKKNAQSKADGNDTTDDGDISKTSDNPPEEKKAPPIPKAKTGKQSNTFKDDLKNAQTGEEKDKVKDTDSEKGGGSTNDRPNIPDNADELSEKDNEITDSQLYMTKSEALKQSQQKGSKDVGAGTPESRAGEAMVHKGLRSLQEGKSLEAIESEFNELVNSKDHILNSKSGKEWVTSCIASLRNIDETVGIKNIETVSWDTPQGREAIGIDPKLETSSDMFVRTKDGKNIGLSLKKTGQVFLNNGGWAKQSEKLLGDLKDSMPDSDHKRLTDAMSIGSYKKDLRQRFQKAAESVGVDEIVSSLEKLKNEKPLPAYFKNSKKYFPILENPKELVEKLKNGKLKGNEMKAYSKLLQYAHKEEYELLRGADGALTQRTFKAINQSADAKIGMNKHIIKSMHIAETLGLNETIKNGGVDGFQTTYGIKPDGAVLNEATLKTLLGSNFSKKLDEVISEVRQGKASNEDLEQLISDSIEIDYDSGQILFKHENNKKYPLFYMAGRTRGIGSSPVMEMAQTPFMAHALKMGTFNTSEWPDESLKKFKDEIQSTE